MRSNKNKRRYVNRPPSGVCIDAPSGHLLRLEKKKKKYNQESGPLCMRVRGPNPKGDSCNLGQMQRELGEKVRLG